MGVTNYLLSGMIQVDPNYEPQSLNKHHALLPQWNYKEMLETKTQNFWITVFLNFQQEMGLKNRVLYTFFVVFNTICSISHGALEVISSSAGSGESPPHRMTESWNAVQFLQGKAHRIELFLSTWWFRGGLYTGIQTVKSVNANVFGLKKDESLSHFCKGSFIPRKKSSPVWKVPFNLHLPGNHRNPYHYFRQKRTGF